MPDLSVVNAKVAQRFELATTEIDEAFQRCFKQCRAGPLYNVGLSNPYLAVALQASWFGPQEAGQPLDGVWNYQASQQGPKMGCCVGASSWRLEQLLRREGEKNEPDSEGGVATLRNIHVRWVDVRFRNPSPTTTEV